MTDETKTDDAAVPPDDNTGVAVPPVPPDDTDAAEPPEEAAPPDDDTEVAVPPPVQRSLDVVQDSDGVVLSSVDVTGMDEEQVEGIKASMAANDAAAGCTIADSSEHPNDTEEAVPPVPPNDTAVAVPPEPPDDTAVAEPPERRELRVLDGQTRKKMSAMDVTGWADANVAAQLRKMQAGIGAGLLVQDSANDNQAPAGGDVPALSGAEATPEQPAPSVTAGDGSVPGEADSLAYPPPPDGWKRIEIEGGVAYYPVPDTNGTLYAVKATRHPAAMTPAGMFPEHVRAQIMIDLPGRSGWNGTDDVYTGGSAKVIEALSFAKALQDQVPEGT